MANQMFDKSDVVKFFNEQNGKNKKKSMAEKTQKLKVHDPENVTFTISDSNWRGELEKERGDKIQKVDPLGNLLRVRFPDGFQFTIDRPSNV